MWKISFADSLSVYFEGTLLLQGCTLSNDDTQKKIDLTDLKLSTLENVGHSNIQPFQLNIVDCPETALNKNIKITLNAQNIENHNGISYLKTTGDSNVLLALTNSDGQELDFNKPIDVSTVTTSGKGSINTLSFGVYAQKPFNLRLNTGDFSSIITFNLNYQ